MDNVIEFPSKDVRDWAIIERSLRSGLRALDASSAVQQRIVERMKTFHEFADPAFDFTMDFDFEITGSMSEAQKSAFRTRLGEKISASSKEVLNAFIKKLFIERMEREIDFCR